MNRFSNIDCINKIYNEDCLETMSRMPDDFVDISITSPPYNVGRNNMTPGKYETKGEDVYTPLDYESFLVNVVREMVRVTRFYVFFNVQMLSANKITLINLLYQCREIFKERFLWSKYQVAPAIEPGVLNSKFEDIYVFTKFGPEKRKFDRCYFKQGRLNNVIEGGNASQNEYAKIHKATFPGYLPRFFINHFSKEGDIIFDPFIGTGTTAVEAIKYDRQFIGVDTKTEYCTIAEKRIKQELAQFKLAI